MSDPGIYGLALLVIPLGASPLVWLLGKVSKKLRNYFSGIITLGIFGFSLALFPYVQSGNLEFFTKEVGEVVISFGLGPFSLLMVSLISLLCFLASIFSPNYLKRYEGNLNTNKYFSLLLGFMGGMIGAVIAGELFTMFVFWELMTLAAYFLITFENSPDSIKAGNKYFLMSEGGALAILAGIVLLWVTSGTTQLAELGAMAALEPEFSISILSLFLIGFGVKAAFFPIHSWLPDAHPEAPSPISALLSGIMIKVGLFWIIKVFWELFSVSPSWGSAIAVIGAFTIVIGGFLAIVQNDIKRLIAYSSISQVGYILMGVGIGTGLGLAGGIIHLLNHALFKGLLFLGAGIVVYVTGTRKLDDLGGLSKEMPVVFGSVIIGALSLAGVPPLNGFYSKWILYQASIDFERGFAPFLLVAALFGSTLSVIYITKFIYSAFLGEMKTEMDRSPGWGMKTAVGVPAILCLGLGIYPRPLLDSIRPIIGRIPVFEGTWVAYMAAAFLLGAIIVGAALYALVDLKKRSKRKPAFMGGENEETIDTDMYFPYVDKLDFKVYPSEIYNSIKKSKMVNWLYVAEERNFIDPYVAVSWVGKALTRSFRWAHNGLLSRYLVWVFSGLIVILWLLTTQ
ncbi:MAG: NADH-quinone oxidoreductase subunit M [Candidatus Bipolaricaulota bacterium]|nr:NADH-quinone oxidoreductase subunit M [Candidatus Bipolaricaulota bacterium]